MSVFDESFINQRLTLLYATKPTVDAQQVLNGEQRTSAFGAKSWVVQGEQ